MTALRLVAAAPAGATVHPSPVVTTVVFTDIVDSTRRATALGDQQWYATLQQHHATSRSIVEGHGGRLVRTIGDGVLASFDTPSRAIHSMLELRDSLRELDLSIRVGIHAGEVMIGADDIGGLTVAIAARLVRVAGPDEIVVSRTVADIVAGTSLPLSHRRWHRLKGIPGGWLTLRVGTRRSRGDSCHCRSHRFHRRPLRHTRVEDQLLCHSAPDRWSEMRQSLLHGSTMGKFF